MNKQTPLPPLKANKRRLGCCSIRFIITSFDESFFSFFRYTSLQKFSFSVLRRNIHHFIRSSYEYTAWYNSSAPRSLLIIRLVCASNIPRVLLTRASYFTSSTLFRLPQNHASKLCTTQDGFRHRGAPPALHGEFPAVFPRHHPASGAVSFHHRVSPLGGVECTIARATYFFSPSFFSRV